jgi:hypothetical protein
MTKGEQGVGCFIKFGGSIERFASILSTKIGISLKWTQANENIQSFLLLNAEGVSL